jgi:hypothetical protein
MEWNGMEWGRMAFLKGQVLGGYGGERKRERENKHTF